MTTFMDMHYYKMVDGRPCYVAHDLSYASQLKNGILLDELCMAEYMSPFPIQSISTERNVSATVHPTTKTPQRIYTDLDSQFCKKRQQKSKSSGLNAKAKRQPSNRRKSDYVKKSGETKQSMEMREDEKECIEKEYTLYQLPFYSNVPEFTLEYINDCFHFPAQIYEHISKKLVVIKTKNAEIDWDGFDQNKKYDDYEKIFIIEINPYDCECYSMYISGNYNQCCICRALAYSIKYKHLADPFCVPAKKGVTKKELKNIIKKLPNPKTKAEMQMYMEHQKCFKYNKHYSIWFFENPWTPAPHPSPKTNNIKQYKDISPYK